MNGLGTRLGYYKWSLQCVVLGVHYPHYLHVDKISDHNLHRSMVHYLTYNMQYPTVTDVNV